MTDLSADSKPFYPTDVREKAKELAQGVRRMVMVPIICDNCNSNEGGTFMLGPWIYPVSARMEIQLCRKCYDTYHDLIVEHWDTVMYGNCAKMEYLSILDATTGFPYTGNFTIKRSSGRLESDWKLGHNPYLKMDDNGEVYVSGFEKPSGNNGGSTMFIRDSKLNELESLNRDIIFILRIPFQWEQSCAYTPSYYGNEDQQFSHIDYLDEYEYVEPYHKEHEGYHYEEEEREPFTGGW